MASAPPPPPVEPPPPPSGYPYEQSGGAPPFPYDGGGATIPFAPPGPAPGLEYAGFWIRLASYLIDVIPIAILGGILNVSLGAGYRCALGPDGAYRCGGGSGSVGSWLGLLVLGVYWVLTWTLMGASLGQRALGLRVVNAVNGQPIDLVKAVLRFVGFVVSFIPLFLGLIWAGFDPRKQGWHDKIAGTYVVRQASS